MTTILNQQTHKSRLLQLIIVVFTFSFLFFPLAHDLVPIFNEEAPHGVAQIQNKLNFSIDTFLKGKYQKKANDLAKKQSGLWRPFTLLGNQLLLFTFNQITPYHSESVFMGKDNQLVQTMHINAFNRMPDKYLEKKKTKDLLANIKFLQDYQAKKGKSVVTVISPNVAEVYPEIVPSKYVSSTRSERKSSYEQMKIMLNNHGINYIDGPKILIEAKNNYPFRMFGRTASHWNDVASCLVLHELNNSLKQRKTASFPEFNCNNWSFESQPRDKDLDLIKIANLLFPTLNYEQMPYVNVDPKQVSERKLLNLPDVTLSGSSYLFAFVGAINRQNLSSNYVHYFYYRQKRTKDMKSFTPIVKKQLDWEKILQRDITIIDAPMRQPTSFGYGFVQDAVKYIKSKG